jgi:DNA-binding response OmpR family regulator
VAGFRLDGDHRKAIVAGIEIGLTRTEFALLAALAAQPGRALSRQSLLTALEADRGKRPTARAIDVYITQLRAKLGADVITTVHGVGYALRRPVPDESRLARLVPPYPGIANALRRQTPGGSPRPAPAGG